MVLDAGAILELVYSTPQGLKLKRSLVEGKLQASTTELAITEVWYILCRRLGKQEADTRLGSLLESGYIRVIPTSELIRLASAYKCERSISLPDCYTLALADKMSVPALFASREAELVKEISSKSFGVKILFLEEMS